MLQRVSVAIGAGLSAALLCAVMAKGTVAAFLLAYLAPMPLIIATLGWGLDIGAFAAAIATVVVVALVAPGSGAGFIGWVALPAWVLGFLVLLRRESLWRRKDDSRGGWFPVGGIVVVAALFGALAGLATMVLIAVSFGGYRSGVEALAGGMVHALRDAVDGEPPLPFGMTIERGIALFVRLIPATVAGSTCAMLCANLYLGARTVQLSQRLARPWPRLPEALVLPQWAGLALVVCLGLGLALRGAAAYAAWIGVGALGCAYAMQGLAVVHALTRGFSVRIPALIAFYIGSVVTILYAAPSIVALGLVETWLSLRARRAASLSAKPEPKS
jgi:hypothetical protein